jgi:hypothetical protein
MRYLLLILISVGSLGVSAQKPKHFPLYKCDVGIPGSGVRLNGLYIQRGPVKYSWTRGMVFYANGSYHTMSSLHNTSFDFTNTEKTIATLLAAGDSAHLIYPAYWGFFTVRNDTIRIQTPIHPPGSFQWSAAQEMWVVKGNKIYQLYEKPRESLLFPALEEAKDPDTVGYEFYPSAVKPDSTLAWYYNKPWFQEALKTKGR